MRRHQLFAKTRSGKTVRGAGIILLIASAAALYARGVPNNPPGFYIDESSIAYNAHLISQTARDEYGVQWPLYFRAFGEYKNPTYIYLLAAIFKLTGPSIVVARLLSALLGAAAGLLLGLLAWRLSQRFWLAMIVTASALLTPWLYESSRLVFEVAAYPLVAALFLLSLQQAAGRKRWRWSDVIAIAISLALVTYTYSPGRLLGPLWGAGVIFFAHKDNRRRVALTLAAYAITLAPLAIFAWHNPGALSSRLTAITYGNSHASFASMAWDFVNHYAADINPGTMLVTGEQNIRDHVGGMGALLLGSFVVAALGLALVIKSRRNDPWWRFVVYALVVAVIPAALTANWFPQLRLVIIPVLLHVLMVPGLQFLARGWRSTGAFGRWSPVIFVVILLVTQGAYFQWLFQRHSPERWYVMDARFPRKILEPALATNRRPIYLYDPINHSGYIQALWHAAVRGLPSSDLVRASALDSVPAASLVISSDQNCEKCRLIARGLNYIVYTTLPSDVFPNAGALPAEAFHAEVSLRHDAPPFQAGHETTLRTTVRNISLLSWSCIGDERGRYATDVHARWRDQDGKLVSEGGHAFFDYDLEPGDVNDIDLHVTAPDVPGNYLLEIDVMQEPDKWFSAGGSRPLVLPVMVGP
jgi:4-amino-4-deoxy-L-arabinose transferase-like glycosyltransferase